MDTSKEYIKMCDSPEIQKGKHKNGVGGNWINVNIISASCCYGVGNFYYSKDFEKTNTCTLCGNKSSYIDKTKTVWLPRQDQLQEIYRGGEDLKAPSAELKVLYDNIHFLNNPDAKYLWKFPTMEQLWLAFVMKEKFEKTWNGEKWKHIK